jgi:hypothetical protein
MNFDTIGADQGFFRRDMRMVRWRILKTLLWKEALRFRYNLGLLVVIGSILALSALVSVSARMGQLPGQQKKLEKCWIIYDEQDADLKAWADYLVQQRTDPGFPLDVDLIEAVSDKRFRIPTEKPVGSRSDLQLPYQALTIELTKLPPQVGLRYRAHYWYPEKREADIFWYHRWCDTHSRWWLQKQLFLSQHFHGLSSDYDPAALGRQFNVVDNLSKIVTALVIFAFYLLSFNIYITSTAEEREKRALLAVMLTPARPLEVILAKVLFYAMLSVFVSMSVVAMYKPYLLLNGLLWLSIFVGSVAYVAIGTVVLCLVRRQTTINTVSMMYLVLTTVIMLLGVFLPVFTLLRFVMVENYLFRQLEQLIGEQTYSVFTEKWQQTLLDQSAMAGIALLWVLLAVMIFRRRGVRMGHVAR